MKRPWQIWLWYFAGLAILVPAFAWLTVKALELDRAELLARRQAELEGDIGRALWRMDVLLTPLLAEEAARPDFVYRPVYPTGEASAAKGKAPEQAMSPLLAETPDFVLLHFEVHQDGRVLSPQCPSGEENTWALDNGASIDLIRAAAERLEMLRPRLNHDELLAKLPAQALPVGIPIGQTAGNVLGAPGNSQVISNGYANLEPFTQQQAEPYALPNAQSSNNAQGPSQSGYPAQGYGDPVAQQSVPQEASDAQSSLGQQELNGPPLAYANQSNRAQRSQLRSGDDFSSRGAALQAYAQRSAAGQRQNYKAAPPPVHVVEGVSRPFWIDDRLLLARRVQIGRETVIQGCWLDWEGLKARLQAEVTDLLPQVELTPLIEPEPIKPSRLLATIPVQLSVPPIQPSPAGWTPIRVSLLVAWTCLVMTAIAAAGMLHSVVTLSERRGAFVSAVTHELRTPLTTFRMYAEMLADGMVPKPSQRQRYLETLRIEADRLHHLVENVLQYARLERGRPGKRREAVTLAELLDHTESRLTERASQAGMKLAVEVAPADRQASVLTDSAAVEQILFNLVDNACKYAAQAADKRIHLSLAAGAREVRVTVRDHGPGISAAGRKKLFQPFSKSVHEAASSAPGVGLGLALSRRLASELGGRLEMQSPADGGAAFVLTLSR